MRGCPGSSGALGRSHTGPKLALLDVQVAVDRSSEELCDQCVKCPAWWWRWFVKGGLLAIAWTPPASAQTAQIAREIPEHQANASFGWERTWSTSIGYSRGLDHWLPGRRTALDVSVTIPLLQVASADAGAVEVGTHTSWGEFAAISTGVSTGLGYAEDPTGSKLGWLGSVFARPGMYWPSGALALDLTWRGSFITAMNHSPRVRDLFKERYPDGAERTGGDGPSGGLYVLPSSTFRFGLLAGVVLAGRFGMGLLADFEYQPQVQGVVVNPSIGGMPFVLRVRGDYRW